jgi:leucyl aminopeptidase (aminopeptidase T)
LQKAANTALTDYLGVSSDETVLIVCDEERREIGLALFDAAKKLCHEALYIEMKERKVNGYEPPEQIADLMRNVDVVICPTTRSLTHTEARRHASKLGVRVATMPGITEDTMIRCLSADHSKIIELTESVAEKLKKVSNIRVTTKLGTDVLMPIRNRRVLSSTGVLRKIGESGNLPSGEVYLAPWEDKTNGVVVFDGSFAGVGLLNDPIKIHIKDGFAVKIEGNDEAKHLIRLFEAAGKESKAVAEFGIGTNYKAKLCGEILEDEKVLGTIHIAFGNNISMGGKISVNSHLDGLVKKPTVYFDSEKVMENGKLLF